MSDHHLDDIAKPTTLCAFCPKMCRFACPVSEAEARETVTPWAKMSTLYLARSGSVDLTAPGVQTALEACTNCGACTRQCAHGNPVGETLAKGRALAQTARSLRFATAFAATGDVKSRTFDDVYNAHPTTTTGAVAYFPGCARAAEGEGVVARDLRALAQAYGTPVSLLALPNGSRCCGYPVHVDGGHDLAQAACERIEAAAAQIDVVVTADPGCATNLRRYAPNARVTPLVVALAAHKERFAGAAAGLALRYHDPCHLGRELGEYEAPRELLEAVTGRPPDEFAMSHDVADCSGGGGLYPVSNPEGAREVGRRRAFEDAAPDVAPLIVTACPSARRNLVRGGARAVDIVDVVLGEVLP